MKETAAEVPVTCTEIAERGLIERYVAGRLGADDTEALEAHYLTCPRCQTELRLALAVRHALAESAAAPRRRVRQWVAIAGLALAATIAGLILLRPGTRNNQWKDLGAVPVAPIYLGVEIRGTPGAGDSLFGVAMAAYDAGRYDAAAAGLRAALAAGADSAPAEFFMASALLMQNRPSEAAESYARVVGLGDTPYLGEAHLYRAKALLRQGRAEIAVQDLRAVAPSANPISRWALALADSIEGRIQR